MKSESIGQRIRRLRLAKGWLLRDLGAAARCDFSQVSNWETDKHGMTFFTAISVAKALGVSVDYLAGLSENPEPPPKPQIDALGENLQRVKT